MLKQSIFVLALAMGTASIAQEAPTPPEDAATTPVAPSEPAAPAVAPAAPAVADESTALQTLAASGYTEVSGLTKNGDGWKATAKRDGQAVDVTLNADGSSSYSPQG